MAFRNPKSASIGCFAFASDMRLGSFQRPSWRWKTLGKPAPWVRQMKHLGGLCQESPRSFPCGEVPD